ncbi:MAG: C4-dicarboxylate ABC transporter substrate-binding protein [Rhodobacteraceae bacterium]|nr:C4-dicarboxylate ABC transporter substrate-binding protein [Paracoccaceae bacterium]|tara:strand:- start:2954 stop:3460 length:507 start_codon:yes stop_codon:yes gene_type:complete
MPPLISYFERITLCFAWVAAWLFTLAGAMLSYEVVARYFFLSPTKWAAELSQLCLIYGTLLSMSWLLQHRRHIQINAVTSFLPERVHRMTVLMTMVILFIFCAYVAFFGWVIFEDSFARGRTTGSLLDLPAWIAELPVPVCFAVLGAQALIEIWKLIDGRPIPKGGHE